MLAEASGRKALPPAGGESHELMQWTEDMSVRNRKMDAQHRKLVELVNRLYGAMRSGQANDVIGSVLDELVEYTANHFADEESLMKVHRFPGLEAQRAQHRDLVKQALELQEQFRGGQPLGSRVFNFLKGWLVNHIMNEDKKYAAHVPE